MRAPYKNLILAVFMLAGAQARLRATVSIGSMTPSVSSPQPVGTTVAWTVLATDTGSGPLTFQFSIAGPKQPFSLVRDFNAGTLAEGTWTSQPFVWTASAAEGNYQIQVIAKDFSSNETATQTASFRLTSLVTGGSAVVTPTSNPLVGLLSAPPCPAGSLMRATFQKTGGTQMSATSWNVCHPPLSMNIYVAGMLASTNYTMNYQIATGSIIANGPTPLSFTTASLPSGITFPAFTVITPPGSRADLAQVTLLHGFVKTNNINLFFPVATDLSGAILWYYLTNGPTQATTLTRPLASATMLTIESGPAWNPAAQQNQLLREIDLAGNIIHETNTGAIQQELLTVLVASDAQPCTAVASPALVGAACLGAFHHDAIRLPNGFTVVLADIEKIFPPGTQGDTSGLPVDILGDMLIVLDTNWQAVWYWEAFQHASTNQLDINRPAILGETCVNSDPACPPMFLLSSATAPAAKDWMHSNSIYYMPSSGDFLVSIRHQDWLVKIDYSNGTGTGNVLWRMGLGGDFTFNNVNNDAYPWFSHQHEAAYENGGTGPLTLFDNGNTRVAPPPLGLGSGKSRAMALNVDEANMLVTPVLSVGLGVYSDALGSAQLMSNGNFFYQPGHVLKQFSYGMEIAPASGTTTGTIVFNMKAPVSYRSWRMINLYNPPGS